VCVCAQSGWASLRRGATPAGNVTPNDAATRSCAPSLPQGSTAPSGTGRQGRQHWVGLPGRGISTTQRPLPDNTQHSQHTTLKHTTLTSHNTHKTQLTTEVLYLTTHNTQHSHHTTLTPHNTHNTTLTPHNTQHSQHTTLTTHNTHNTQHSQQTDIDVTGGIRTRNPSKPQTARPLGLATKRYTELWSVGEVRDMGDQCDRGSD
jgi:hypothetical protein